MKVKSKKPIFVCQISDGFLKVIKCLSQDAQAKILDLELQQVPSGADDKALIEKLARVFKKLAYSNNPVIFSLGRSHATCRYLRVPAQAQGEIEKILSLSASRYLPYPNQELITAYEVISTDKEGYSYLNLVIVHKTLIERYARILKELKVRKFEIILSAYGLTNFSYQDDAAKNPIILLDIDTHHIELAITKQNKLLFSRDFKFNRMQQGWERVLTEEIKKTCAAYLKEVGPEPANKIIVLEAAQSHQTIIDALRRDAGLPVEVLSYNAKAQIPQNLANLILNSDTSFVSLIGLGLRKSEESLNLLPQDIKEATKRCLKRRHQLQLTLLIMGIILIWVLAIARNLENKTIYLERLKTELSKIEKEARPLEKIEDKFKFIQNRLQAKPSGLEVLSELPKIMPAGVALVNFNYEEDKEVVLRGQAQELNSVFDFVAQLEKSTVFKGFNIKVRYATKRKLQTGEIVDFEITCMRK